MSMASIWKLIDIINFMRTYTVPPGTNDKEKIIGGILNINQFFWVLGGLVLGATMFAITFPFLGKGSLFIGFIFCLTGVPFVVFKKNNLTLFQYLKLKHDFKKKTKHLPNKRKEVKW